MFWRPKVIRCAILSTAISLTILTILITLMLIPSIIEGPDRIHSLVRTNCMLMNVSYLDNYCFRDTTTDFTNLIYQEDWKICKIAYFQIQIDLKNINNCTWIYPTSFSDENEAKLAIEREFILEEKYSCVVDTSKKICYTDKHEVFYVSIAIGSLGGLTIIFFLTYFILKIIQKRKEKLEDEKNNMSNEYNDNLLLQRTKKEPKNKQK